MPAPGPAVIVTLVVWMEPALLHGTSAKQKLNVFTLPHFGLTVHVTWSSHAAANAERSSATGKKFTRSNVPLTLRSQVFGTRLRLC